MFMIQWELFITLRSMNHYDLKKLEEELIQYTIEIGEGKNFETNSLEIRHRLNLLNVLIDEAIDGENNDYMALVNLGYHYYRLYYG